MRLNLVIASVLVAAACQPAKKQPAETTQAAVVSAPIPYALDQPAETHKLPNDLREISGLSYYKPGKLACVQDELGVVFIYDTRTHAVADEHIFGKNGDYEGVEFVDGQLYIMRSDGELYQMEPRDGIKIIGGSPQTRHVKIDLPGKNDMEGLGYDPQLKALVLATKDGKGLDKTIYLYSLQHKTLFQGTVLKQEDIRAFEPDLPEFKPSGIAVHPKTRDYYVLSSAAHRLLVMTPSGKVKSLVPLDEKLLRQPEGICFAPDGTLYIASEGDGKKGVVLVFDGK
ncbi:hypothetical protein FAES_4881 [Fibrella aestuarina BUZ 2]|uniref:Uncharacterized protein n=1 Tax=Fibrella aestuarina BUZ 2 TaxID=1166018 RepID=I0KFH7_9BACT|nr:SdiA-regulated domain-containing protein [Fibrella aestuarina]CCH02880.1 hypothetical protein FAES_4881 [Fibrella aestuarina BUZ 2]